MPTQEEMIQKAVEAGFDRNEKKKGGKSDQDLADEALLKSVYGGLDPRRWTVGEQETVDQN